MRSRIACLILPLLALSIGPAAAQAPAQLRNKTVQISWQTSGMATSPEGKLVKILKYHVVGQRYDAATLVQAGTVESLEGGKIQISGTSAAPTVNGAQVMCGNIPTKNATVFVIEQVLSPPAT